jgi:integrase
MNPKVKPTASGQFRRVAEGLYVYEQTGHYFCRFRHKGSRVFERLGSDLNPCTSLPEAKRLLRHMRDSLEKVNHDARKTTLHDVIASHRAVMKGSKGTLAYKLDYLKKLQKSFKPSDKVADVTAHDIRVFLKQFDNLSPATKNHIITMVREVFATAVEKRCISADQSPMNSIKFFKVGDQVKRLTPTEEQFKAIVDSIRSQKFSDTAGATADLVEFIGQAGLGQAECDELRWKDINFDANNITLIRRKTQKQFSIPIYPMLLPLLDRMNAERKSKNPEEKVFAVRNPKKALQTACKRLDYPHFTARSLRRMFIIKARRRGVPPQHIAKWQGHRDVKMVLKVYDEATDEESMKLAALMKDADLPDDPKSVKLPAEPIAKVAAKAPLPLKKRSKRV